MNAAQSFSLFQQAQKNLVTNPNSEVDRFMVDLWNSTAKIVEKNNKLTKELDEMTRTCADYSRKNDLLLSKAAKDAGQSMLMVPAATTVQ